MTAKVWLMTPDNKNIQVVNYDFELETKFPRGFESCQYLIDDDMMEYFLLFFDAKDGGAYNQSAEWIAPFCGGFGGVAPTGNFVVMRKKSIDDEDRTIDMDDISPKDFKEKYLK